MRPLELHVDALLRRGGEGLLIATNEPAPAPAPRLYLGRDQSGYLVRVGRQTPLAIRAALQTMSPARAWEDQQAVLALLAADTPCTRVEGGPVFYASAPMSPPALSDARPLTPADRAALERYERDGAEMLLRCGPICAVVLDGEIRSLCFSSRVTDLADEAGVETAAAWRGLGYGSQVVLAWIASVQAQGKVALYSTSWGNTASQALARSLMLKPCGEDLAYF